MFFRSTTRKENEPFNVFTRVESIAEIVRQHIPTYSTRTAVRFDNGSSYQAVSFNEYGHWVESLIPFFAGFEGKVIATFCKNRPEWDMVALSTFFTGNVLFPLDTKTNNIELSHLLKISPPDFILTTFAQRERIRSLCEELGVVPTLLICDLCECYEDSLSPTTSREIHGDKELSIAELINKVEVIGSLAPSKRLLDPDSVVARYPTSGTTAMPKVVQISHGAVVAELNEAIDVINLRPNEEVLNIGPYTHIATIVEFLVSKTRGFPVTYFTREPDDDDVLEDEIRKLKNQGVRIKALMAVPKFWIYVMKEVLEEMKNKPVLENLYRHLTSIERSDKLYDIGTIDKAKLAAMRTLLRNKLGGYFSYGISSSMKLDGAVVEIFGKLGITVIDIYGATEVTGIIARNRLNDITPGSCGKLIQCLDYKLRDFEQVTGIPHTVGELLVKGPTTLHSYVGGNPGDSLTEDGYFPTGDLGWVDDQRRVWLLGRKKELINWFDGSYIDPQHLSNLLVRSVFIKDAMVVHINPEDRYLSVFVYPDYKRIGKDPRWNKLVKAGVREDEILKIFMTEAIDYAESIAHVSAPLRKDSIHILPRALERTPTHKIKYVFERTRIKDARII